MHSDQTGALPILGKHKEKYLVILFDEGSNFIYSEAITELSGKQLASATECGLAFFKARGSETKTWRLDNQVSHNVRKVLAKSNIVIDLTPVGQHRRNKAERAIRTFKNHFIATLAGVDKDCPLELWPEFLEQIEFTLNLMRTSPSGTSAWSSLHGPADLNKSPIAPLGIKVVAHVPVKDRASWDSHGDIGFYVGRALDHYRCYKVWIPKTKSHRIFDCLAWFPVTMQVDKSVNVNPAYPLVPPGFAPLPAVVAPSLVPPTTGGKERVVDTTGGKERVAKPPRVIIQNPEQLVHQKRNRSAAFYVSLSESEMHKLPAATVNKIGQYFVDTTDAPEIIEGIITTIVRERKSRSLCYKYYDSNMYASAPRNKDKFEYIVVKWALPNVKFSKSKPILQAIANAIVNEQKFLNNGPGPRPKRNYSRTKSHRNRAPRVVPATRQGGETAFS
jgi:hypothetical protein